jgi:hypothetical protein
MVQLYDRAFIDGPARITREGHFVAKARVARANNIQDYAPAELGLAPKPDGSPYRIFRPEAAIFAKDSLATALHRPIVINHPKEDVNAANWKALSVGDTGGEIMRDGDTMVVPIMVMDAKGVDAVQSTHPEFSWGYSANLDMTPGKFGDEAYDGSITPPHYNHLAMCPRARGGSDLRVTDALVIVDERPSHNQEQPMKIKIGDAEVDPTNGEAVSIAVGAVMKKLGDAETALATVQTQLTDANAKVATLETEKATLEKKLGDATLTPEKLRDAAKSYAQVTAQAKALGVTVTDAMDEPAIMKAVVEAKMGDTAKGWDDKQIAASFAVLAKDAKVETTRHTAPNGQPVNLGDARASVDTARKAWLAAKESAHSGQAA